ncbi:exonuclease domain-containing protein [Bacteroidota bacterium]
MTDIELIQSPIDKAEFSVIDFETTGISPQYCKVIEIGIVKVKNMTIHDTYQNFINPKSKIPPHITLLTGIKDSDVENSSYFEDLIPEIIDFIGDSILTAHNMKFDYSFLNSELIRANYTPLEVHTLCTMKLARNIYPQLPSKSLKSLVNYFRIKHKDVHRALGDSMATVKILLKMIPRCKQEFNVKTIGDLILLQDIPSSGYSKKYCSKKLLIDYSKLPNKPGVYFFKNKTEEILYIGKAKSLKKRVLTYFSDHSSVKAKKIVKKASRLGFYETNSELTALVTEAELVKSCNPDFNTLLKKYTPHYFIKIKRESDFPIPKTTSKLYFDDFDYFGPYSNREIVNTMLEVINKAFMLRECNEKEFAKNKKCYLSDLKRCLAPCEKSNEKEYKNEVNKVYEFLLGNNQIAVNRLLDKMKKLSLKKRYEEAADIRDIINLVLNNIDRISILSEPVNKARILIKVNQSTKSDIILLIDGKLVFLNNPLNEQKLFDEILEDYFSGTVQLFKETNTQDLERLKITLSWLVKNRNKIRLFYLKDYKSKEELIN